MNIAGDFAYILQETSEFWLIEQVPIMEFFYDQRKELKSKLVHRGYMCSVCFVKEKDKSL